MLPQYKTKTTVGILVGIFIMFTGSNISTMGGGAALFQGGMILLGGWFLLIWGCVNFAKGKGYTGWFGLFGLLLLPGLVVLVCLRDKHRSLPTAALVHTQEVDKGEK